MSFFDFFKTRVDAPAKHSHIYKPNHICTHDFGIVKPIFRKYMVPGDEFSVNLTQFTRLMPMPAPTFGVVKSINRAFFVPLDYVMTNFDEYIQGNFSHSTNIQRPDLLRTPHVPVIYMSRIVNLLGSTSTEVTASDKWDLMITDVDGVSVHRLHFDWKARKRFDFCNSLGLNICRNWSFEEGEGSEIEINALPILAFWKFYIDCVVPVRFRHNWREYEALFTNYDSDNYLSLNSDAALQLLFKIPTAWLSPDYFNSAFENPFGVDYSRPSVESIQNPAVVNGRTHMNGVSDSSIGSNKVGSRIQADDSSTESVNFAINAFTIQSLGVLQDMINRNRISDVRVREWLLQTYGIAPNNDALHLSTYLGSSDNDILIGDIMATAQTEVNNKVTHVGQYAGKGLGGQNAFWQYPAKGRQCEHHGYLFVTNELCAKTSYIQGLDPDFRYLDRRQYFDPKLDNFGVTAIEKSEIGIDVGIVNGSLESDGVFGFKPNYAEMKKMSDVVSGDFRVPSLNEGLDSWYLSRLLDSSNWINYNFINEALSRALEDGVYNNYDRIFQNTSTDADHFYSVFRFEVHAQRPMVSVTEILESKESSKGHDIKIDKQI